MLKPIRLVLLLPGFYGKSNWGLEILSTFLESSNYQVVEIGPNPDIVEIQTSDLPDDVVQGPDHLSHPHGTLKQRHGSAHTTSLNTKILGFSLG